MGLNEKDLENENKRLIEEVSKQFNKELYQLKNFCSFVHDDADLEDGVALKDKKSGRIFCFEYFDFQRGRGELYDCRKSKCKFYCYVNKSQTKLTDFVK